MTAKHVLALFALLALPLASSFAIQAKNNRDNSVLLAVENSWPPYADVNGEGISTSIIRQAYATMGIKLMTKVSPYARVLDSVEKGIIVGGYNVTRQASTEKIFLFGKQAVLQAAASFYFPAHNPDSEHYKTINDIPDGSRIGLIIDYEYGDIYEQHRHRFQEVRVSKQEQIINMLSLGRLDSAIMFNAVAGYTLKSMGLNSDVILQGPLNHTSDIYVAFSKSHKKAQYFSDLLDQGLKNIKTNGQYQQLLP